MHSLSENGRLNPAPEIAEDRELIAATLQGDQASFEKLVNKYQRQLYAALRRLVRRHDDTDDLVQECLLRAYQHLHEFDTSRPFYPWLHRIAINLAITFLRRSSWRQTVETLDIFPSADDDPHQNAERGEFYLALEDAIAKLPVEQRTILLLRTREGMNYRELSQTLGIEIGTVMSRLARAREKVRSLMRRHLEMPERKSKSSI